MAGIGGYATRLNGAENFQNLNTSATSVTSLTGNVRELVSMTLPEISMTDIDVSSMDSASNFMEFLGGSKDPGTIEVQVNYARNEEADIIEAFQDANEIWTITFPDSSSINQEGYINKIIGGTAGTNEKLGAVMSIKCSGQITHNETFVLPPANNTNP